MAIGRRDNRDISRKYLRTDSYVLARAMKYHKFMIGLRRVSNSKRRFRDLPRSCNQNR